MSDSTITINTAVLNRLILMIPGSKSVICKSKADYSPHIEPGQKHIDHIAESGNENFALREDGIVLWMRYLNDWNLVINDRVPITLIFSLPTNGFGFEMILNHSKKVDEVY